MLRSAELALLGTMAPKIRSRTAAAAIDSLPPELILDILEELLRTGTKNDLIRALRVCKLWQKLGAPLIWTTVAINNSNLVPFVCSLTSACVEVGRLVRNLSILLNPIPRSTNLSQLGFPDGLLPERGGPRGSGIPSYMSTVSEAGFEHYARKASRGNVYVAVASYDLATQMKAKLCNLRVFSFRYTVLSARPGSGNSASRLATAHPFPLRVIVELVESLPTACSQVEVSTSGLDKVYRDGTMSADKRSKSSYTRLANALSKTLSERLPYLTHLSLEAAHISSFIFEIVLADKIMPNLRSLRLDITSLILTYPDYKTCAKLEELPEDVHWYWADWKDENAHLQVSGLGQSVHNILTRELYYRYESNTFPIVAELLLVFTRDRGHNGNFLEYYRCDMDFISECTRVQPMARAPFAFYNARYRREERLEVWILISRLSGDLVFMDENQVDDCGNTTWVSSTTGVRVPACERNARTVLKHDFDWSDPLGMGLSQKDFNERVASKHDPRVARHLDKYISSVRHQIKAPFDAPFVFL
jgi:hypothetical protein